MSLLGLKNIKDTITHFVGIGGIGMSGIAEVMCNLGYKVQGSDIVDNHNTRRLKKNGIKIFLGHKAENVICTSFVVVSSAINNNNPEIQEAIIRGIPILRRSEMLAELMKAKCAIAVSGSHGKTTTTSLVACLFESAGFCPTVINGGIINNHLTNAYIGSSDYLIVEADESDETFVNIPSTIVIVTNIDYEHIDYYKNFPNLIKAFKSFIVNIPFSSFAVCCVDHYIVRNLVHDIIERKIITYGITSEEAHIRALNIKYNVDHSIFDVAVNIPNFQFYIIKDITLPIPGQHNILNSLASIALGVKLGFNSEVIQKGFINFKGVDRRFSKICDYNGASIINDYAHHPVEVKATLATAKSIADKRGGRVVAIFQPHRYSRVRALFNDFINCFTDADKLYITEIYSANEPIINKMSGRDLVDAIKLQNPSAQVSYIISYKEVLKIIKYVIQPGDLMILMGAGNINTWIDNLLPKLG